jgi:proteasome assembly chaperone (PAC2) family protein
MSSPYTIHIYDDKALEIIYAMQNQNMLKIDSANIKSKADLINEILSMNKLSENKYNNFLESVIENREDREIDLSS